MGRQIAGAAASPQCHCFRSVNAEVPFDEGFYLENGAQFISQTGPQADLGEQGPERGGRPRRDGDPPKTGSKSSKVKTELN
jgi:hypothetical protein